MLDWGFANRPVPRIVAITAAINRRSQAVMQRLGMVRQLDLDFDHPQVPDGDPLQPHVTYYLERPKGA